MSVHPETSTKLPPGFIDLLSILPDAIVVTDSSGRIVAVNANFGVFAGYAAVEIVGTPIERLVPARFGSRHAAQRADFVRSGGTRQISARLDIVLRRADDTEIPVDIALSTFDSAGERLVVATLRDATVRRLSERAAERERVLMGVRSEISEALLDSGTLEVVLDLAARRTRELLDADLVMMVLPSDPTTACSSCGRSRG